MNYLIFFSLIYLYLMLSTLIKASKKGTLYLWSPVIVLDVVYVVNVLIPYLLSVGPLNLNDTFFNIVFYGLLIQIIFHLILRKYNYKVYNIVLSDIYRKTNKQRYTIIICSLLLIILIGLFTGVTTGLITGKNIEDLRRTSEVGIGFIRDIPMLLVQVCTLIFLLSSTKNERWKFMFIGMEACILFVSTGNKAPILNVALSYIAYLTIKYRGLKIYEYMLYYFSIPIAAAFLNSVRQGSFWNFIENFRNYFAYGTFIFQVNTVKVVQVTEAENAFLNGEEFISGIYKIIPRFIWNEKPLSFDYYYKDLIEYDFDGGGTPIALIYRFYTNFGESFYIYYILWLLFVVLMYRMAFRYTKGSTLFNVFFLFFILCNLTPNGFLSFIEVWLLMCLVCIIVYKKISII